MQPHGGHVLLFCAAIALPFGARAAHPSVALGESWALTVDAQLRARFMGHTGKDFADGDNPAYISQRARLGASIGNDAGLAVTLRLQDVRIWGEEANTLNDFSANRSAKALL